MEQRGTEREGEEDRERRRREYMRHCYACCLVTASLAVQKTEAMREKPPFLIRRRRPPYFMEVS
jgi:hypothetical protein